MKKLSFGAVLTTAVLLAGAAYAGAPFNNAEGVGGVALNPLAYLADGGSLYSVGDKDVVSKPRFGTWYFNLPEAKVEGQSIGTATTLFKRLEVSYGYQNFSWVDHPTFKKSSIGTKLLVVPENSFEKNYMPAISVGSIYKTTSAKAVHELGVPLRTSGQDWYAVATKTITALPRPVILSGGAISSQGYVTGLLGYHDKRKITWFYNVDVVLPHNLLLGYEFKQGEQFSTLKNANYFDVHVAWMANQNLTLIAAYLNTGVYGKSTRTGWGNGLTLSAQYAF